MIVKRITLIIALLAQVAAATAEPHNPKSIFYSDQVLHDALAEIAQMPEAEVRAFIHYLSKCVDSIGEVPKYFCRAAQTSYEIEYGNERALDNFIAARSEIELLRASGLDREEMKDVQHIVESVKRDTIIISAIYKAAGDRLRSLKGSQK